MKTNRYLWILLIIVLFVPLADLLNFGLPITHDGQDHVARIANFYQNLKEGNIIPRWAANLNWGYGHPILMFLYPLPSYVTSFFHFFGFSLVDSLKIVFGLFYILSGLAMYLWVRNFIDEKAGIFSASLYVLAPYRFVDLYVRGAIGEHVAFVFPPLIFYFLLKISRQYSPWFLIGGSLSLGGLILSHNAITLMFLPLIFLYAFYLAWQMEFKKNFIFNTSCITILGFGLASFFWIPAFWEGKYTLRDIVTQGGYATSFVQFKDFFYGVWSYGGTGQFTVQLGVVHWLVTLFMLLAMAILYIRRDKQWMISLILFMVFLISLFLMTSSSKIIWEKITILQKFQFPWRFLSVTTFITAIFGAIFIYILPKSIKTGALFLLIFLLLFLNKDYWHAKEYMIKTESFHTGIYEGTTDTGESAPIWSVRFMEKKPKAHLEIIEGNGIIEELSRKTTDHQYKIIVDRRSRIRENTLYFPGWKVYVNGKQVNVEFQDPQNRGLITFYVPEGKNNIVVVFKETKLRNFANMVSLAFFSVFIILFPIIILRKRLLHLLS